DIDGDGTRDLVRLVYTPGVPASCGFGLRITTRFGTHFARVVGGRGKASYTTTRALRDGPFPRDLEIVDIDHARGRQILVGELVGQGESLALFSVRAGRAIRL